MLTDREQIEHWHLRDAVMRLTVLAIVTGFLALGFIVAAVAWPDSGGVLWFLAAGSAFNLMVVIWRLIRVWRRIDELEAFIP